VRTRGFTFFNGARSAVSRRDVAHLALDDTPLAPERSLTDLWRLDVDFEADLARVEEHVAEARRMVQRQKGILVRLAEKVASTLDAQRILWLLESNLSASGSP